jgi:hypothetical protein
VVRSLQDICFPMNSVPHTFGPKRQPMESPETSGKAGSVHPLQRGLLEVFDDLRSFSANSATSSEPFSAAASASSPPSRQPTVAALCALDADSQNARRASDRCADRSCVDQPRASEKDLWHYPTLGWGATVVRDRLHQRPVEEVGRDAHSARRGGHAQRFRRWCALQHCSQGDHRADRDGVRTRSLER